MNKIDTLATGGTGVGLIEVLNSTGVIEPSQGGVSAIIQIVIGIITIIKLLKRKKDAEIKQ